VLNRRFALAVAAWRLLVLVRLFRLGRPAVSAMLPEPSPASGFARSTTRYRFRACPTCVSRPRKPCESGEQIPCFDCAIAIEGGKEPFRDFIVDAVLETDGGARSFSTAAAATRPAEL